MDSSKKRVSVRIFGTEYIMMGNNSEEYIKNMAEKVDTIMKEIAKSNTKYNPTMIAVLTALNLADVLYKTQEELEGTSEKLEVIQTDMQRPYDEINDLTQELEAVKEQYAKMQNEYTRTQIELGKASRELTKSQEELKDVSCELDVARDAISDLQGKLFEHQIELLKTKKELDETKNKRFDKNKSNRINNGQQSY